MDADSKSRDVNAAERRVRLDNWMRAKSCPPLLTEAQKNNLRGGYAAEEQAREGAAIAQRAAARAAAKAMAARNAAVSPPGVIDVRIGQFMPRVAGGIIDPRSGTFHQDVGAGYVNSRTGQFSPKR